jgi:hypothetical protein
MDLMRIRIQHFFQLRIRIPDPDPGFDDLKLKKNIQLVLPFTYPLASIKDAQATGEAFSPQKRTSSTSKYENSVFFSIFVGHFCPSRSGSGSAI